MIDLQKKPLARANHTKSQVNGQSKLSQDQIITKRNAKAHRF
jgi:hypothetical protein